METNCSDTDMMKVVNRSLTLTPYPDNSGNTEKVTVNGKTQLRWLYQQMCLYLLADSGGLPVQCISICIRCSESIS